LTQPISRIVQLQDWLARQLPEARYELAPASADASFRRYFRLAPVAGGANLADGHHSLIVMDAPPPEEDCRPWLAIARLFHEAGVHVPEVLAENPAEGFLLIEDLGAATYLDALRAPGCTSHDAARLYADAFGTLLALQAASRPGVLPEYSGELLRRELMLFPEWYVGRHKGLALETEEHAALLATFDLLVAANLAEPRVFVHRDFHSRNLMCVAHGVSPGVVDFQDAVYGPITYDLVSLLKDAYIGWEEDFVLDLLARYWETARRLGLPVGGDFAGFHRDFEWMGIQRHLKVLGIFARLHHRDGKDAYLADMPLVMRYLRRSCERYDVFASLLKLLDRLEPAGYAYTF
jgi:aminoglycoside/choline kinase family phosphotransferase